MSMCWLLFGIWHLLSYIHHTPGQRLFDYALSTCCCS
ncbi:hypothetical protein GLYMA_07G117250v4 [Glycine max]|nr:hypothetical protein GLYMA_07G117250v4 [Glycine max]KAH1086445.1 hypothetical protein GYH30_018118 [Glycine max]